MLDAGEGCELSENFVFIAPNPIEPVAHNAMWCDLHDGYFAQSSPRTAYVHMHLSLSEVVH